jgi:fibronectin type 3 domain-containing protein
MRSRYYPPVVALALALLVIGGILRERTPSPAMIAGTSEKAASSATGVGHEESPPVTTTARATFDTSFAKIVPIGEMPIPENTLNPLFSAQQGETVRLPLDPPLRGIVHMREEMPSGEIAIGLQLIDFPQASAFFVRRPGGSISGQLSSRDSPVSYRLDRDEKTNALSLTRIATTDLICARIEGGRVLPGLPPEPEAGETESGPGEVAESENIPLLDSRDAATKLVYLDFDGETVTGTAWNSAYNEGDPIVAAPYANPDRIPGIWESVAEDYRIFDVNVTTSRARYDAAAPADRIMIIFSPTKAWYGSAGGVAYVGSFGGTSRAIAWVFNATLNGAAESGSHEVGHTLGLRHDGTTNRAYYSGHTHASGVSWAPIMGTGYSRDIVQFSKGDYAGANRTEDDFAVMRTFLAYRPDDHADSFNLATPINSLPPGSIEEEGVITSETDSDVFRLQTDEFGTISVEATPLPEYGNLDAKLELFDADSNLIALSAPDGPFEASLVVTNRPAGVYYLRVSGSGLGNAVTGYTAYGSVGTYTLTGTYPTSLAPPTPTGLSASDGLSTTAVSLNWEAAEKADGYRLYRAAGDTPATAEMIAGTGMVTTYDDTTATPGVVYYYFVTAFNEGGESAKSAGETGFARLPVPATPSGLTATDNSPHEIRVTWESVAFASSYRVLRNSVDLDEGAAEIAVTMDPVYRDKATAAGETAYYFIIASNSSGDSLAGGDGDNDGVKLPLPPGTPTGLTATSGTSPNHTALSWTAGAQASGYYVYRNVIAAGMNAMEIAVTENVTSYLDTGGVAGTVYYYFVRAILPGSVSDPSSIESGYRLAVIPEVPGPVSATRGALPASVRIEWPAVTDAANYSVSRGSSDTPENAEDLGETADTHWIDNNVAPGRTYYYFVRAGNSAGLSAPSEPALGYGAESDTADDAFENNDSFLTAFPLDENGFTSPRGITARAVAGDPDWYEIVTDADAVRLDLAALHGAGNEALEMALYDAGGALVATSDEGKQSRVISVAADGGVSYFILVEGNTEPMLPYRLFWKSVALGESGLVADQTIGLSATSQFGLDLVNATGAGQTLSLRSRNRGVSRAVITTHNRSAVGAVLMTRGTAGSRFFRVNYLRGEALVTAAALSGRLSTGLVPYDSAGIEIRIKRDGPARRRSKTRITILSYAAADPSAIDVANLRVANRMSSRFFRR